MVGLVVVFGFWVFGSLCVEVLFGGCLGFDWFWDFWGGLF